jgi:peptidyl-prolyl cis-trans isomerase SurA
MRAAFALLAGLATLAAASAARADEMLVDGIAAQVGGEIVLVSEVMRMVEPAEQKMREAGAPASEIAKLRAEGLERMIEWRLVEQVVVQFDMQASDEEVDGAIASIAQENGISVDEVKQSIESHGMRWNDYRAQIKRELEQHRVMNAMVRYKVSIDEKEIQDLYDERFRDQPSGGQMAHLRQILILFGGESGRPKGLALDDAKAALARIADGESFEMVARDVSEVAPERGGDLGWLPVERLSEPLWEAVSKLQHGQTSEIMELPMGWSLFKLVEVKDYQPVSYEEARPALEMELFEVRMAAEYAKWMEDLREKTFIERRGHFAAAANLGASGRESGALRTP